jgi:hypothetical protein
MSIRLFVSHISEEAPVAKLLRESMSKDFIGLVEFFTSSDIGSINAGENWLVAVQKAIEDADGVIVLCSHASVHRPWVQFELGAAWMRQIPIYPVCHSGLSVADLPIPLSLRQGIELGTEAGMKRLYHAVASILKLPQVPEPRDIAEFLKKLAQVETVADEVEQYERHIDIILRREDCGSDSIPDDACVESNEVSLELFGLNGTVKKWRDIRRAASKRPDQRWVTQLEKCVQLAGRKDGFRPMQAVYHSESASYQPQLAKKVMQADGTCRFHIHFIETTVARTMDVENDLGLAATMLRLGLRFRYEVLEKFRKGLAGRSGAAAQASLGDLLHQMRCGIETVEFDAISRGSGTIDREAVDALFDAEEDLCEIAQVADIWDAARMGLFCDAPAPDLAEVKAIVARMREVNYRFMRLASRRFHELICTRLAAPKKAPSYETAAIRAPAPSP